jgi:DNA-binding NarL/FixJ family response regulator
MVRGLSDKQIARELDISESTVKTHVRAILAAVGVARRGQAVFRITG